MPFTTQSPDLQERISLGLQSVIQTMLCPLTAPGNGNYRLPAGQVYQQDLPIPTTGCMFPAVIVSIEGEIEQDDAVIAFGTDASIYPNLLSIVHTRDMWDQHFQPAATYWRKQLSDLLRSLTTLPGCPEVYNVWCERRAVYHKEPRVTEYVTSDLLVRTHAAYARVVA